jgi:pimeloyl-ACP methyl ester carboxylesterase
MDYELTVRGLLTRAEAAKSAEAGYPHTSVQEPATAAAAAAAVPTAAAAAVAVDQEPAAVQAIEAESGGSAKEAASAAVEQGLESPLQATAAAAGEGSVTGVVKGAAAAVAEAATGSSSSEESAAGSAANAPSSSSSKYQQRVKRVLMGHSLGGACAALEYVFNPSEYAAVILVDPAIIAGLRSNGSSQLEQLQDGTAFTRSLASGEYEQPEAAAAAAHEAEEASRAARVSSSSSRSEASSTDLDAMAAESSSSSGASAKGRGGELSRSESLNAAAAAGDVAFYATRGDNAQFAALLKPNGGKQNGNLLSALLSRILALVQTAAMLSTVLVLSVLRPVIVLLLRSLVRSRKFWANTLRQAYYDQSKVTPAAVDAYRMPQLVKGWESGMVQFLLARLGAGGTSTSTSAAAATGSAPMGGLEDAGLATRFAAAVAANNTPVLIVHGAGDKLVPASNSFKLARLVKGCRLAVVKKAGHCPQEEEPELFADIVASFLARHAAVQGA